MKNNNTFKIIFSWILVLIWMLVIFSFSNMNAIESNNKSKNTINTLIDITERLDSNEINNNTQKENKQQLIDYLNYPLRKYAHAIIYFILSLLILNALHKSNVKNKHFITLLICFLYALTDEYHQTFITGRTGQFIDVIIDTIGAYLGIIIYNIFKRISDKKRQKNKHR